MSTCIDYVWIWTHGERNIADEWSGKFLEYEGSHKGRTYEASSFTSMIVGWLRNRGMQRLFDSYDTGSTTSDADCSLGFAPGL